MVGGGGSGGGGSGSTGCRCGSAGSDTTGGGDTGSSGGAGGHARGEAGTCSSGAGGNSVGEAVSDVSEREGEDGEGKDGEGGESGSGEAMQNGGEWRRSPSPSTSRNNSTSLCRLRVLLAGGVMTSGEDDVGTSPAEAATAEAAGYVGGTPSVLLPAVVAARPRHRRQRRRRLTTVAAVAEGVGRLHLTVMTCNPAAWLNTTRAFKPLARQRSYKAKKSAMETVGCSLEQAGSSTLPLTTHAHVAIGETREVAGREGPLIS